MWQRSPAHSAQQAEARVLHRRDAHGGSEGKWGREATRGIHIQAHKGRSHASWKCRFKLKDSYYPATLSKT